MKFPSTRFHLVSICQSARLPVLVATCLAGLVLAVPRAQVSGTGAVSGAGSGSTSGTGSGSTQGAGPGSTWGSGLALPRGPGNPPSSSMFAPATAFTWVDLPHTLGPVTIPFGPGGGWQVLPGTGIQWRLVPGWSSDPTLEILLQPGASGDPNKAERFLLQFPMTNPNAERAMVIGFHQFGVSEKAVFNATSLPFLCADKGWFLLAPYGLIDTHYGNTAMQESLDRIIDLVRAHFVFDPNRIYAVGFSMGGGAAVSYSLRHQDKLKGIRIAGVVNHTGTLDLIEEYNTGSLATKNLMSDADHFAGNPTSNPFAYERVNPLRVSGNTVVSDKAYVANLLHIPFFLHLNLDDPNTKLITWNIALKNYLLSKGATFIADAVHAGPTHSWTTLDMRDAIDWIEEFSLPPDPSSMEEYADRSVGYLYTEVRALTPNKVARYVVQVNAPANTLTLSSTFDLGKIAIDLSEAGLNPASTVILNSSSGDGSSDTIVLKDYLAAPSSVLVFGLFPPQSSSYDPSTKELTIVPNTGGTFAQIVITP